MYTDYNDASSDEEMARNKALEDQVRNKVPKGPAPNLLCECGELIPEKRRLAGYTNCVDCQTELENFKKRYGAKNE